MVLNIDQLYNWIGLPADFSFQAFSAEALSTNPIFPKAFNYRLEQAASVFLLKQQVSDIFIFEKDGAVRAIHLLFKRAHILPLLQKEIGTPTLEAGVGIEGDEIDSSYFSWDYKKASIDLMTLSDLTNPDKPDQLLSIYNLPYRELLILSTDMQF